MRGTAWLMQARRGFDVVLISLRLPGNEGPDTCTSLHASPRSPSIALVQSERARFAFFDTTPVFQDDAS